MRPGELSGEGFSRAEDGREVHESLIPQHLCSQSPSLSSSLGLLSELPVLGALLCPSFPALSPHLTCWVLGSALQPLPKAGHCRGEAACGQEQRG